MEKICGNCKYFKESNAADSIIGRCKNKSSKTRNKDTRTYLTKSCYWFECKDIVESILLYDENDELLISKLLYKMENDFPNKLNKRRALAIRHLLADYRTLNITNLKNNKKEQK